MLRGRTILTFVALFWSAAIGLAAEQPSIVRHFQSVTRSVAFDELDGTEGGPVAILLPGTSGPAAPYYQDRARALQRSGISVLVLHYFDATQNQAPSEANYEAWVLAVRGLLSECKADPKLSGRKIALVGYSLGASIALAAGSQAVPVDAIAEWYGSLPDSFFYRLKGMPPLLILHGQQDSNIPVGNAQQLIKLCGLAKFRCESHIYAGQAHGFVGSDLADADLRTIAFLRGGSQ